MEVILEKKIIDFYGRVYIHLRKSITIKGDIIPKIINVDNVEKEYQHRVDKIEYSIGLEKYILLEIREIDDYRINNIVDINKIKEFYIEQGWNLIKNEYKE